MSGAPKCLSCKATLRWERMDSGEWRPDSGDDNVAIRCLDCSSLLCGPCARRHFEESGLLATSQADVTRLTADNTEAAKLLARAGGEIERLVAELADMKNDRDFWIDKHAVAQFRASDAEDKLADVAAELAESVRALAVSQGEVERARRALDQIGAISEVTPGWKYCWACGGKLSSHGPESDCPGAIARHALSDIPSAGVGGDLERTREALRVARGSLERIKGDWGRQKRRGRPRAKCDPFMVAWSSLRAIDQLFAPPPPPPPPAPSPTGPALK